jgi:hypothetical protein
MSLEDLTGPSKFLANLNAANPLDTDFQRDGAAHLRGIKNVLLNSLPGVTGAYNLATMLASINSLTARMSAAEAKAAAANPVGAVQWFLDIPAQWYRMNGQTLSKSVYAALWAYASGGGGVRLTSDQAAFPGLFRDLGGDSFALPNLAGHFVRALGGGAGSLGAAQAGANLSHTHTFSGGMQLWSAGPIASGGGGNGIVRNNTGGQTQYTIVADGGTENRPLNVAYYPCMYAGQ